MTQQSEASSASEGPVDDGSGSDGVVDVDEHADRILADGRIVEVEDVGADEWVFDAGSAHMLVEKPIKSGIRLTGQRSLLIQGDFEGSESRPSQVDVQGDVVVTGNIRNAQVSGRRILTGGTVSDSQLKATLRVQVGGDAEASKILAGDFEKQMQSIRRLEMELKSIREKQGVDARGLSIRQREVHRVAAMARFNLDFGLGQMLQLDGARANIDLEPFYKITGDRTEDDITMALKEFFQKAVVGLMTKKNIDRLRESSSRQSTFKHLVRQLSELFMATRKKDVLAAHLDAATLAFGEETAALCATDPVVRITGKLTPETDIQFVRPLMTAGEQLNIGQDTATLSVREEEGKYTIQCEDVNGKHVRANALPAPVTFRMVGDVISWG